ncbi:MAG: hypothetical protein JST00_36530 [Deltaproteobacteria bacterium]|nr:hypothetical protein [Deltaproteobacteria bacterium]
MIVRHDILVAVSLALLAAACGPAAPGPSSPTTDDAAAKVAAFRAVEDDVLRALSASDRRFAMRVGLPPQADDDRKLAMGALLAEDASLAAVDGAIDVFSFQARERAIAKAREGLAKAPGALPEHAALESELLARVVSEESERLDEERRLPRSASALLRAIVETWRPPGAPEKAAERDRWLSRRLGEVTRSIEEKPLLLDVGRARELDDALDALEHFIDQPGFGKSTAELVRLREKLEAQGARPSPGVATSDWDLVSKSVKAHLGIGHPPEMLDAWLGEAQKQIRARADAALAQANVPADTLATRVSTLLDPSGERCADAIEGSILRALPPPPERTVACRLRHALAAPTDEASRVVGLVAMHDAIVVARWSLDVARGAATLTQTSGRHRPLSRPAPDIAAKWEREALARPAVAIGGGLAAVALYGPKGDELDRAKRWSQLGDVPLDLAIRELH